MKFIQGFNRNQMRIVTDTPDDLVDPDAEVRVMDAFVDSLPIEDFGFKVDYEENGRPAYHPSDLVKLFLYGYRNGVRSSRQLEKLCKTHLEVIWLMRGLEPDHNTIANFRKDNAGPIAEVFKSTVKLAKDFGLIGGKLLAGDGTKLRAQNSKKNNYNPKKIERHLDMIDGKVKEYMKELAYHDGDSEKERQKMQDIKKAIRKQRQHKKRYEALKERMEQTGEEQISTSDPDARHMIIRGQITEVAYNVQSTVDAQHSLPIDYKVTNTNDSKAMGEMVERATGILGHNDFTALYDKGYHTGGEFEKVEKLGARVMVAIPAVSSHAPDPRFDVEHFTYHPKHDYYTCPANKKLTTNGRQYKKSHGKGHSMVKHYKTSACHSCLFFGECTVNPAGRLIERPEHAHLIEKNRKQVAKNLSLYKRRQAIVEHPFGTMKRAWGFDHIMTKKSITHASADVGLIFTAYNLVRLMSILGKNELKIALGVGKRAASNLLAHMEVIIAHLSPEKNIFEFVPAILSGPIEGLFWSPNWTQTRGFETNCRYKQF